MRLSGACPNSIRQLAVCYICSVRQFNNASAECVESTFLASIRSASRYAVNVFLSLRSGVIRSIHCAWVAKFIGDARQFSPRRDHFEEQFRWRGRRAFRWARRSGRRLYRPRLDRRRLRRRRGSYLRDLRSAHRSASAADSWRPTFRFPCGGAPLRFGREAGFFLSLSLGERESCGPNREHG